MKLGNPFNGPVFDQMYAEAVEVVSGNILKAYTSITGSELKTLQDAVGSVMTALLQSIGFDGMPAYNFGSGDNGQLVGHVVQLSGVDATLAETIISEIYTDDALGLVPHWFGNIAEVIAQSKTMKETFKALQPSFFQRVAGTIFKPVLDQLGLSGSQAVLMVEILIAVAVLIAIAYFWRSFR